MFILNSGIPAVMLRKNYIPHHAINKYVNLDFTEYMFSVTNFNCLYKLGK